MSTKKELLDSIPSKYSVLNLKIHKNYPIAYALVTEEGVINKQGLKSTDGGKTWEKVWEKE